MQRKIDRMIRGIGIDMTEPARIRSKVEAGNGFAEHVFSQSELAFAESVANKFEHLAGRFAAKEALLKALGTGLSGNVILNEVTIVNGQLGQPFFKFTHAMQKLMDNAGATSVHLSITHVSAMACAVVIIEGK